MEVSVDEDVCMGHGLCVSACPEVFQLADDDSVVTILDARPDDRLRDRVIWAVDDCPVAALTIEE